MGLPTESVTRENNELKVKFAWLAKGEGFPPIPKKWYKDDRLDYVVSLTLYLASDIGSGDYGDSRICLNSNFTGEICVLFPPNGSKLDPSKVEGLQLAQA